MVCPVKRLLQMFGLALALLWVPVASHCSWESLVGGDFFKCAPASEKGDCSGDADDCASVESGGYKISNTRLQIPVPVFIVAILSLPPLAEAASQQAAPATAAPSGISSRWQFIFRTALPPRAPSFVS
jgi:hypothetical protein